MSSSGNRDQDEALQLLLAPVSNNTPITEAQDAYQTAVVALEAVKKAYQELQGQASKDSQGHNIYRGDQKRQHDALKKQLKSLNKTKKVKLEALKKAHDPNK